MGEVPGLYHHAGDLIEYFVDIYHPERGEVSGLHHHAGGLSAMLRSGTVNGLLVCHYP